MLGPWHEETISMEVELHDYTPRPPCERITMEKRKEGYEYAE